MVNQGNNKYMADREIKIQSLSSMLIISIIPIIFGIVFTTSCDFPSADFSEYRGINYISDYPLTSSSWQLSEGTVDNSVSPPFEYMKFTQSTTTITDGLPANSGTIYRLEVSNLIPNGGFETTLSNWATVNSATITREATDPHRVHNIAGNNSIKITLPSPTSHINFNLDNLLDNFIKNKEYIIRNNFTKENTDSAMFFEFNNNSEILNKWIPLNKKGWIDWVTGEHVYTEFPLDSSLNTNFSATENGTYNFTIGSIEPIQGFNRTEGFIDDLRVIRSDIEYFLSLSVPSGRPDIVSGKYRFSFYLLADGGNYINADNRIASPKISFGFSDGKEKTLKSLNIEASDYSNSKWTEVYIEKFISKNDSIELLISSVDNTGLINTLDIGSIFIAFPQLYYVAE